MLLLFDKKKMTLHSELKPSFILEFPAYKGSAKIRSDSHIMHDALDGTTLIAEA